MGFSMAARQVIQTSRFFLQEQVGCQARGLHGVSDGPHPPRRFHMARASLVLLCFFALKKCRSGHEK
jgi:hypothetical protein